MEEYRPVHHRKLMLDRRLSIADIWRFLGGKDMEISKCCVRAILHTPLSRTRRINSTTMASSSKYTPVAHPRSQHGDMLCIFIIVPRFGRDRLRWPRVALPGSPGSSTGTSLGDTSCLPPEPARHPKLGTMAPLQEYSPVAGGRGADMEILTLWIFPLFS